MKFIKKFIDFLSTNETFEIPQHIEWDYNHNSYLGYFTVDNMYFVVVAKMICNNVFIFKFKNFDMNKLSNINLEEVDNIFNEVGLLNDKLLNDKNINKYKVLATVKYALDLLLTNTKKNGAIFSVIDNSRGRITIYERFCETFINKNKNFTYTSKTTDEGKDFFIYNKNKINKEMYVECAIEALKYKL